MAASMHMFIRARGYRVVTSRVASFRLTSSAKRFWQDLGFKSRIPTPYVCFSLTHDKKSEGIQRLIAKKNVNHVFVGRREAHSNGNPGELAEIVYTLNTDDDAVVHECMCSILIGKNRQNIRKLKKESGIDFHVKNTGTSPLLVFVPDVDALSLKSVTEKITDEVQRIRNLMETVLTDEDAQVHNIICKRLIGKDGKNFKRLQLEAGKDFHLNTTRTGTLVVLVTDAEVLKSATEKVTEEVQRIRNLMETVETDENGDIHNIICKLLIGKDGQNLKRLQSEAGEDFQLNTTRTGSLVVLVTDAKVLKSATEKVTEEVQIIRNLMETVETDENADVTNIIYRHLLGKGGQNLKKIRFEAGIDFRLENTRKGTIYVTVSDAEVLKSATEKITEEVQRIQNLMETVFIDENADVHCAIWVQLIGKGAQNFKRFQSEAGIDFELDNTKTALVVSATDAKALKRATKKLTEEVHRIRDLMETVFTDENATVHIKICSLLIGKGGQNVKRLRSEAGIDFNIADTGTGTLYVAVTDAKMLKRATEKVTEEVQRIRNLIESGSDSAV